MKNRSKKKKIIKFIPLIFGLLIYLILIPTMILGFDEGFFQTTLLVAHAVTGLIAGIITGFEGVVGIVSFTCLMLGGYLLMVIIQPDSLWVIGFMFLGITQTIYWGGWLFGCLFNKPKLLT